MVTRCASLLAFLVALHLGSTPASAADVWVDPIHGDDSQGGTGPNDAWRTITFALEQLGPVPGPTTDRVHLLPGIYARSAGGGEEGGALVLRDGVRLVGEGPRELVLIKVRTLVGLDQAPTAWDTGMENLTIESEGPSLSIMSTGVGAPVRRATIRDVQFRLVQKAIRARWDEPTSAGSGLRIENCSFVQCNQALWANTKAGSLATVDLRDSDISEGASSTGFIRLESQTGGELQAHIERCLITSNLTQLYALRVNQTPPASVRLRMTDSALVSPCLSTFGLQIFGEAELERCTFAGHEIAVQVTNSGPCTIKDCLFGDNYTDLEQSPDADLQITNCMIDDPRWSGVLGNLDLDADFVDRFSGDYSLLYGSPGIDALPAMGGLDLEGRPRSLDGDLDSHRHRDMGAYEFGTLAGPNAVALGAPISLELSGDSGELARLYLSRVPLQVPFATPYGDSWLPLASRLALGDYQTAGSTPLTIFFTAPNDPALAGTTLGFQALQRNPSAPSYTAWSSPVFVQLE